jgi:4-hydroxythreonine-4-phosphate dehydrogenase
MGDPAGIGGEIIVKFLTHPPRKTIPVVIGDITPVQTIIARLFRGTTLQFRDLGKGRAGDMEFVDLGIIKDVEFGKESPVYGEASYLYIIEALRLIFLGKISALVTCPINKASLHSAGAPFTGHTELLAHFGGTTEYVMMMANREMRVSLVTIHIPLKQVPQALSLDGIFKTITITEASLRNYFNILHPHIKVCGLNPHAGEKGLMGDEERLIEGAIVRARSAGMNVTGPYPADTLFHRRDCDAYVAMYHDQGLIPVKTVDFRRTVNITLGLPFVRTSPGHGTGFDIAGQGIADPSGLREAYRMAELMRRSLP